MITTIPVSSNYQYTNKKIQAQSFGQANIKQTLAPIISHFDRIKPSIFKPKQTKPDKCYLVACCRALLYDKKNKNVFKEAITKNKDGSYSVFYKGLKKSFRVSPEELNDKQNRRAFERNPAMRIFEAATRKMLLSEHFWKKHQEEPLKFYFASAFMKKFTGKKPLSTGEFAPLTLNNPLSFFNKRKAIKLLEKISDAGEGNFTAVGGTEFAKQPPPEGRKYGIRKNHYYVIKKVDKENKIVSVENPRLNEPHPDLTYKQFFDVFRSVVLLSNK